jgi:hypothetical protein
LRRTVANVSNAVEPRSASAESAPERRALPRSVRVAAWLALVVITVGPVFVESMDLGGTIIFTPFAAVGLALVYRRPRQPIGWILVVVALAFVAVGTNSSGSAIGVVDGHASAGVTVQAGFGAVGSPIFYGGFVALAVLFPAGRFGSGRMARVGKVAVAIPLLFALLLAFGPGLPINFVDGTSALVTNPVGILPGWAGWPVLEVGVYAVVVGCLAVGVALLLIRFRIARGPERQQYKWLLTALALTLAAVVFSFLALLLVDPNGTWMWFPVLFAYPTIPLAIGIAVTRYRLYEIDRLISRTIAYGVVTAVLAALFLIVVLAVEAVLRPVTGSNAIAVAGSTLLVASLFQPIRRRVQLVVDRRFNRSRLGGEQMVAMFAGRLRDDVGVEALREDVVGTVTRSLEPTSVSLWLRE